MHNTIAADRAAFDTECHNCNAPIDEGDRAEDRGDHHICGVCIDFRAALASESGR